MNGTDQLPRRPAGSKGKSGITVRLVGTDGVRGRGSPVYPSFTTGRRPDPCGPPDTTNDQNTGQLSLLVGKIDLPKDLVYPSLL